MKTNNMFHKVVILGCSLLFGLTACDPKDEAPSVDDCFLNYYIPDVEPTSNIPVGVLYYSTGSQGIDEARYDRLTGEYVADGKFPQFCPQQRPVLGRYAMNTTIAETANLIQQHLDWAQEEGGIDFFILPAMRYNANGTSSKIQQGSANFVNYLSGKDPLSEGKINWGSMHYALSVMMNDFTNGLSADVRIEDDADADGISARCEALYEFFVELAYTFLEDELYYRIDNKPMLVLWNAHQLYSKDSKKLYDNIRQRVKEATGLDLYLVARQPNWSPAARFHNFFMTGGVDAVYMDNMFNQMDWARSYMYPQYINENYKYNRQYTLTNYNIDFIPAISTSYNAWMWNGTDRYNVPIQMHDEGLFHDMCNVAKINLGQHPMVIIDAFNNWEYGSSIEPTDPYYGNGYGMKYLNIVREEFKLN